MTDFFCDYYTYGNFYQPGDQPSRVLIFSITEEFEKIKSILKREFPTKDLDKINLRIITQNSKVIGPYTNGNEILLHDSFLSFLWCFNYGIMARMPQQNSYDKDRWELGGKVIEYGRALLNSFPYWDKEILPNPELYSKELDQYVGKTNFLCLNGINFIVYHEFAHIILDHFKEISGAKISDERALEMEKEADQFALKYCSKFEGITDKNLIGSLASGYTTAIGSLFITTENLNGGQHPNPHQRLLDMLNYWNFQEDNMSWSIAVMVIMEWQVIFKKWILFAKEFKNPKQYFTDSIKQVEEVKERYGGRIPLIEEIKSTAKET
ncbi:phage exclusion protein Lit family protein [Christiangramia crocea]|uniref:Uncharacterized protein n=1 Tax=Christiangramia crocea TaxID=2904124 RepID=A0A9X1UV10_9FLAO|nr:phage exclusion protein Lit family protein [Gramella crocea]MCG9970778.1 hypothetical protein [Gramella crocea]